MQTADKSDRDLVIENEHIEVQIHDKELLSEITNKVTGEKTKMPTSMYTYPTQSGQTLSGLYVFNPKQDADHRELDRYFRFRQTGPLMTVVFSIYKMMGTSTCVCQQVGINTLSDPILAQSVEVVTKIRNDDTIEITMRSELKDFDANKTEIYIDNSISSQLRQFYTFEEAMKLNLTENNPGKKWTWLGLNGYSSIDGSAFYDKSYFGFVNSHSKLIHCLAPNIYEMMLIRNTNYYDDKGITDPLRDNTLETYTQLLFQAKDSHDFWKRKTRLNDVLNNKLSYRIFNKAKG